MARFGQPPGTAGVQRFVARPAAVVLHDQAQVVTGSIDQDPGAVRSGVVANVRQRFLHDVEHLQLPLRAQADVLNPALERQIDRGPAAERHREFGKRSYETAGIHAGAVHRDHLAQSPVGAAQFVARVGPVVEGGTSLVKLHRIVQQRHPHPDERQ